MTDFVKEVERLMQLPKGYCKACGKCCEIGTARGCLTYEELLDVANKKTDAPIDVVVSANDFLATFVPFDSIDEARKVNPHFVDMILKTTNKKEHEVTFFHCRYLKKDKKCQIYEDRPTFCRKYPVVDKRTFFFEGCGLEKIIKENIKKVDEIIDYLEQKKNNNG